MTDVHRRRVRHLFAAVIVGALVIPFVGSISPASVSARVRCTQRVRGPHTGTLNVGAGQMLCLKRAQQTGDINVAAGGRLKVIRSTVNGSISLASGFVKFSLCGSRQTGGSAVNVVGGTRGVLMGGTDSCAGNSISGALNMTSNQAGFRLGKNAIVGAVTLATNQVKSRVSGNRITGALNCSGNAPAPSNGGDRNRVTGARSGQTCEAARF